MSLYYSGKGGKKLIRNAFPHHILMANLNVCNKYLHSVDDRSYWENITQEQKEFYIRKAEEYLNFTWKSVPVMETYMEYFTDENHSHLGDVTFLEKRDTLLWLTIGECIEDKGRFLYQIVDGIFSICEQSTWAPPSHFMQCGETKEMLPDPDDPVLDLYATLQGCFLSITYRLLHSKLEKISPVICLRIEKEIEKRIINPFLTRDLWWMCQNLDLTFWSINNWTTHCCYGILFSVLALECNKKTTYQVVNKVIDCVDCFADAYPDDGACDEGPSYWGGAIHDFMCILDLLETVIGGKTNVWEIPKFKKMSEYILHMRIHENVYASVSDAHPIIHADMSRLLMMYHQGKLFKNEAMIQEAAKLYSLYKNCDRLPMDFMLEFLYWEELKKEKVQSTNHIQSAWMPGVQIMSSHECADTARGLYLCIKGGTNGESHNHNDIGNFIIYKNGKPIIVDAGIGLYTNTTFGEKRYTNWWANGFYHNIPMIDGIEQKSGPEYKAENVVCTLSDEKDDIRLELRSAYENKDKITSLTRKASLDRTISQIVIEDVYDFSEAMGYDCILLLKHKPKFNDSGFTCGEAVVQVEGTDFESKITEIDLTYDSIFTDGWGEKLYRLVLHFEENIKGSVKLIVS